MSAPSRENALDHVVVVMFENRSFDNLLGRLYEPGEVASFEGVIGKELSNRVPDWAEHRPQDGIVSYGVAANMNTPSPDSGEEYPHINTQLFGILDEENRFKLQAEKSFNEPRDGQPPTMDGFLADYISMLTVELGRQPTVEEYSQIMTGYTPAQMPVLSAIARGFATFDHWFCDVPTCTYPNRSFFHAGASSGYVVNTSPPGSFPRHNDAETLFDRLDAAGLTWKVYCDPPSHYSLTGVIHAPRLASRFATNFFSTRQFFQDAQQGELPTYSFIEPQIIGWNHNDMHPPFGGVVAALGRQLGADDAASLHFDPPSSLIGGEDLLARIYDAIRDSSSATGSNHLNTTLLVTFDEHGGTYDHVPPPPAIPPDGTGAPGQMGFTFNRSGVRIPTLAISAWIPRADRRQRRVPRDLAAGHDAPALQPRSAAHRPRRQRAQLRRHLHPGLAQGAGGLAAGHPTPRPRDARIPRPPRRAARPAGQVAPARRPSLRPGPRQDRPRHQARRHHHRRTRHRHRPRDPRRHLPRNARLNHCCSPCRSTPRGMVKIAPIGPMNH